MSRYFHRGILMFKFVEFLADFDLWGSRHCLGWRLLQGWLAAAIRAFYTLTKPLRALHRLGQMAFRFDFRLAGLICQVEELVSKRLSISSFVLNFRVACFTVVMSWLVGLFVLHPLPRVVSGILRSQWLTWYTNIFHLLVMRSLVRIWTIDGAVLIGSYRTVCIFGLFNYTRGLEWSLSGLLMVTFRHINIFVHIVTHRTPSRCSLPRGAPFIVFLEVSRAAFYVFLVGFGPHVEHVVTSNRRAVFCCAAALPSQQTEVFWLIDGADDGLKILLRCDSFIERGGRRSFGVLITSDLRIRIYYRATKNHLLLSSTLFLRLVYLMVDASSSMLISAIHLRIAIVWTGNRFDLNVFHVNVVHHVRLFRRIFICLIIFWVGTSAVLACVIVAHNLGGLIFVEFVVCYEEKFFVSFFLR